MPSDPAPEVAFVAGEARADVFAGFGGFLYGGVLLILDTEYSDAAWVIVAFGAYMIRRYRRSAAEFQPDQIADA